MKTIINVSTGKITTLELSEEEKHQASIDAEKIKKRNTSERFKELRKIAFEAYLQDMIGKEIFKLTLKPNDSTVLKEIKDYWNALKNA